MVLAVLLAAAGAAMHASCARKGLVSDRYDEVYYHIPRLFSEGPVAGPQRFIVYSDNQTGWRAREVFLKKSSWTNWRMLVVPFYQLYLVGSGIVGGLNYALHKPDYGGEQRRMVRDAVYASAKRNEAAFIMNVGDIAASDGRRPSHWKSFLDENRIEHPLLDEIPYLPVIGNHEYANDTLYGFPNFSAVFGYPRFYTVEFENAVLIVVDSNFILDQGGFIDDDTQDKLFEEWFVSAAGSGRLSWLENQLAAFNVPFKIIAMHHPMISYGAHYEDWLDPDNGRDLTGKRRKLLGLFDRYGVQVVFSGHDHLYQHNVYHSRSGGKIHFIVGGGGGTPLRKIPSDKRVFKIQHRFEDEQLDVSGLSIGRVHHYYLVNIVKDGLQINVIEVTGDSREPERMFERIVIARSSDAGSKKTGVK
jgi:hypothetical protein